MKFVSMRSLLVLAIAVGMMACNPLNKMAKRSKEVNYTVVPNPLEMHADSVAIDIQGSIPAKFFNKKVSVEITPILEYNGKEKEFKSITLSGEASEVEGTKISYTNGGSFSHKSQIPYEDGMQVAVLKVKAVGKFKEASKAFEGVKIAEGTNITPYLLRDDDKPLLGEDNFKKVVPVNNYSEIHYLINSPVVRGTELTQDDISALKDFIKTGVEKEYVWKNVTVDAYASPDGEITLNENLANQRAASAAREVSSMLRRSRVEAAKSDNFYVKNGKGEDWAGFKTAMEASEIKDKNLILRVLEMYNDPKKREEEIKNLAATFVEVADRILPQLRRSQITLNAELKSRTDGEIKALADSAPDQLTVEELLYAATMTNDLNAKLDIYQKAATHYPEDWRGPNNIGFIYVMQNKMNEAKAQFDKAAGLNVNNAVVNNNLGVCARKAGNIEKALEYYESAEGKANEVSENIGLIYVKKGDYEKANQYYKSSSSFNAALAKLLADDVDASARMLNEIEAKDAAYTRYLKAIIEARNNNKDAMLKNLKAAVDMEGMYKKKAKEDIEFIKYRDDSEFQAAVN